MTLLALDIATRTGVCLCEPFRGARPQMRLLSWQLPASEPPQEKAEAFVDHLVALTAEERIEFAAIEIPLSGKSPKEVVVETELGFEKRQRFTGQIQTQNLLWGLHLLAVGTLHALRIPYRAVGVKEWRKHTLGNGNIDGKEAKRRCKELMHRLDVHCPNTDCAEAGGIMFYLNGYLERFRAEDALKTRIAA